MTELPTSYCTILINDTLVYRTRAKAVSSKPIFNAGTERFMRDWRSGIVTITVRDQRNREHDPILGVVPLRLSEILSTSSQVTRWYPLDGGIGFGRARISLLFRSVETRLPPQMLGWDVGTFEFISDRIVAAGWTSNTKLKLRTGGSTGKIPRTHCHRNEAGDGVYFDVSTEANHHVRLPVKYRYRSPVIFEFHVAGKRGAAAYASIWLQNFVDNEDTPVDIPIWSTKNGSRLTQNYITEENAKAFMDLGLEDLKEVGRLQFRGRFKAGMDESHRDYIVDNNTRETYETFEACLTEGVRERVVEGEVPDNIQEMHEASLKEGRDIIHNEVPEKEKRKWTSKTGDDWSGAFSHDPRAYTNKDHEKIAEPGTDRPPHDPYNPSDDDDDDAEPIDDDSSDLGITDGTNAHEGQFRKRPKNVHGLGGHHEANGHADGRPSTDTTRTTGTEYTTMTEASTDSVQPVQKRDSAYEHKAEKRSEERKHRGLSQWTPARNVRFAKDEAKIGVSKLKKRLGMGSLSGREPGVETEA